MNRRTFLVAAAATSLVPLSAQAEGFVTYTPGVIKDALASGQTVFVDYGAKWCSTCARQKRIVGALRGQNPAYDEAMTFVSVDWDDFKSADVTTSRNIPRRSTLIVLRGDEELGRLVAGTSEGKIKALMDLGLS